MINLTREVADLQATYTHGLEDGCGSKYELHEGLLVIPILGDPEDTPVIVRVHSPFTTRKSAFSYTKSGAPPFIPSPGDTKMGYTFLGGYMAVPAPGVLGKEIQYSASGLYGFVAPKHVLTDGKIMFDAHPYASAIDNFNAYNREQQIEDDLGNYYNSWNSQYFDLSLLATGRILR